MLLQIRKQIIMGKNVTKAAIFVSLQFLLSFIFSNVT